MNHTMEDLLNGRISADDVRERLAADVGIARKRLTRMTQRRPLLACGVALAAGYMAGRLITRW